MSSCPNFSASIIEADTVEKRQFGLAIYIFGQLYILFCFAVFLWGKYKVGFDRVKKRHAILVVCTITGALIECNGNPLEMMVSPTNYYCAVKLILSMLIIPFIGAGIIGKLVSFFFRTRFEQQAIEARQGPTADTSETGSEYERTKRNRMVGTMAEGARELFLFKDTSLNLGSLRFLQSGNATAILLFGVFIIPSAIVAIIVALSDPLMALGCTACLQNSTVVIFLVFQGSISSVLTFAALLRVRRLPDNWGIIGETWISVFFSAIGVIGYALTFFTPNVYPVWDFTFLMTLGVWGIVFTQTVLQVIIAWRKEGFRHHRGSKRVANVENFLDAAGGVRSGSLSSPQLKLPHVLADPDLAKRFEEHLGREFGVESLFFYRDAQKWTVEYNDVSVSTRKARAKHIVNIYIRNNGVFAINVPSVVSKALISSVDQQVDPPPDFFATAMTEIQNLLEIGALTRFRQRELGNDKQLVALRV